MHKCTLLAYLEAVTNFCKCSHVLVINFSELTELGEDGYMLGIIFNELG
jgi:hypothetical protein